MQPYISIAIPSRNDDYSGNMAEKRQFCFDVMLQQLKESNIPVEVIVVDWNTPPDRPPLRETLQINVACPQCTIAVLEVPQRIHNRYEHSDKFGFNGVVAVNAAFRRSRGSFFLIKCTDTIWSHSIVRQFSSRKFDKSYIYRCTRSDVDLKISDIIHEDLMSTYDICNRNTTCIHEKTYWNKPGVPNLFTNACGDFQLISGQAFVDIRGYYESSSAHTLHADGLLSYSAYKFGLIETIIPDLTVHKLCHQHTYKNRVKRIGGEVAVNGITLARETDYERRVERIMKEKYGFILNSVDWGLGGDSLETYVLQRAEWDHTSAEAHSPDLTYQSASVCGC